MKRNLVGRSTRAKMRANHILCSGQNRHYVPKQALVTCPPQQIVVVIIIKAKVAEYIVIDTVTKMFANCFSSTQNYRFTFSGDFVAHSLNLGAQGVAGQFLLPYVVISQLVERSLRITGQLKTNHLSEALAPNVEPIILKLAQSRIT